MGSLTLNKFAGLEYDRKTNTENDKGEEVCRDNDCFVWSFRLSCGLTLIAMIIGGVLFYAKTKEARRLRDESQRLIDSK